MDDLVRAAASAPDAVYTLTVNLMWQLYYEAADQGVGWLEADLLTAISELDCGPWRHLGADWLAKRNEEAHTRRLVAQLEKLGHTVVIDPAAA